MLIMISSRIWSNGNDLIRRFDASNSGSALFRLYAAGTCNLDYFAFEFLKWIPASLNLVTSSVAIGMSIKNQNQNGKQCSSPDETGSTNTVWNGICFTYRVAKIRRYTDI